MAWFYVKNASPSSRFAGHDFERLYILLQKLCQVTRGLPSQQHWPPVGRPASISGHDRMAAPNSKPNEIHAFKPQATCGVRYVP